MSILDQFLDPTAGWLTPQAAQKLVDWHVSDETRARIEELGRRANRGELTPEEDLEYRETALYENGNQLKNRLYSHSATCSHCHGIHRARV